MGRIIEDRTIECHMDSLGNESYFLHGDPNRPKLFIDDVNNAIYHRLGVNSYDEVIYMRIPLEETNEM